MRFNKWWTFPTIISLAAGLLTNLRFQFGGVASAGELVLAVIAFFAVVANVANPHFWNRRMALIIGALCVSFCGYVISDLINATPADRLVRGWARMAFVIIDFIAIWALARNNILNLFAVCVGDAFSTLLSYGKENADFLYNYKFHLSMPITVLIIIAVPVLFRQRAGMATGIAQIGVGMCHMWFDCRTGGAICVLIGFVLIARSITASRLRSLYLSLLALALVLSSIAIGVLYTSTNSSFSVRRAESNSLRLGLAMGGINAIERSPFIGLGSWAWDQEMWNVLVAKAGRVNMAGYLASDPIGAHSQIIQAWAEAGLLGTVFFIFYGRLLAKSLWTVFFRRTINAMTPLLLYYLLTAVWDLLFSPFANLHRFGIALALVITIQVLAAQGTRGSAYGRVA